MDNASLQTAFFRHIKRMLPPHLSMAEEVAEVLNISTDSAYRRIRGEKSLDLVEMQALSLRFHISIDQLMQLQSDAFIFTGNLKTNEGNDFELWLDNVQKNFQLINSFEKKHIYYLMKDIPPFVYFQVPELASFKSFLWMKSILHYNSMKGVKFSLDDPRYEALTAAGSNITKLYSQLPATEIWNMESINSTLRQIQFYQEAGAFKNRKDIAVIYTKLEDLINHIERQAEEGVKFIMGSKPMPDAAPYQLFVNELILGDNTLLAELGDKRITFLNHSVLYFVATTDERFNNSMFSNLENLVKKSTMISTIGEKERVAFFNRIRAEIHLRRDLAL